MERANSKCRERSTEAAARTIASAASRLRCPINQRATRLGTGSMRVLSAIRGRGADWGKQNNYGKRLGRRRLRRAMGQMVDGQRSVGCHLSENGKNQTRIPGLPAAALPRPPRLLQCMGNRWFFVRHSSARSRESVALGCCKRLLAYR